MEGFPSFLEAEWYPAARGDHILFVHSSADGPLAAVDSAIMNTGV